MAQNDTSRLLELQAVCDDQINNFPVALTFMGKRDSVLSVGPQVKIERERRKWSQAELASRVTGLLFAEGSNRAVKQQSIDQLEKLKLKSLPDWTRFIWRAFEEGDQESRAAPDRPGMIGEGKDPNEKPDELVYIREVDISLAMGEPLAGEDYPATQLVPFNMGFIRAISQATTDKLMIFTGQGESMEPTLLRSDLLMIDTSKPWDASDQIWAFHYAGGGMIKRLRRVRESGKDRFLILSDNPSVPPQSADIEDVHLIGKLIWVGRRM